MAEHINSKGQKDCVTDDRRQFINKTGKIAPEHKRLSRYGTRAAGDIAARPTEATD